MKENLSWIFAAMVGFAGATTVWGDGRSGSGNPTSKVLAEQIVLLPVLLPGKDIELEEKTVSYLREHAEAVSVRNRRCRGSRDSSRCPRP